jgi:hypothetical protein
VQFYGIGIESWGYEEFNNEKYFACGKIYVDETKELFKGVGFNKIGFFEGISKLISSDTRKRIREAKAKGFDGNLKGEVKQIGGMLIVSPKGEILYEFKQNNFGDEPSKEDIFAALDKFYAGK